MQDAMKEEDQAERAGQAEIGRLPEGNLGSVNGIKVRLAFVRSM